MSKEKPPTFVNLGNARNDEQRGVMENIEATGDCPFCPDNLHKYHKEPILREGKHWLVTPNQWPYKHTRVHLLAIATYHAEDITDLREGSLDELQTHLQWASAEYQIAAGGLAMRFGSVDHNGATVRHLHAHIIVPELELGVGEEVRFRISSKAAKSPDSLRQV